MRSKRLETIITMLLITAFSTMAMGLIAHGVTANALRREITNAYQVSLLHTRDRMETYLRQLDRLTLQLEKNPVLEGLVSGGTELAFEPLSALPLIGMLQRIHVAVEHMDNVVVYDQRSGSLYASNPVMNRVYSDYIPIMAAFNALDKKRAFFNLEVNGIPVTAYVRRIPAFSQVQPLSIIFHANQRLYDDILGEGRYGESGKYFILDHLGDLLALRGSGRGPDVSTIIPRIKADLPNAGENGVHSFSLYGDFITYLSPSSDGWVFGFSIPNDIFLSELNIQRNIILLVAITLLVASIVFSVFSSHRLWRGWNRIRAALDDKQTAPEVLRADEFEVVFERIKSVVSQSASLRNQMDSLMPTLKDSFTLYLLDSGVRTVDDRAKAGDLGITLLDGAFCCFCIEMDRDWEPGLYTEHDIATFDHAIFSVVKETVAKWGTGHVVRVDQGLVAALVCGKSKDTIGFEEGTVKVAENIRRFISDYFPVRVSAGVGGARTNYNHLNVSFREARESLRNKYLHGGNRVHSFRQAVATWIPAYVPIREMESDVLFGIRTKNTEYSYRALEQLRRLKGIPNLHYPWLQARLAETVQSIYRQAGKYLEGDEASLEPPILDDFQSPRSLEDWETWFREHCVDPLINRLRARQRSQDEQTVRAVREYIQAHMEEDLRLEECSADLRIPVSSAKAALREVADASFMDIVLEERIKRAKDWLCEGDFCVETIARRLRYSNAQNFSRTFKKAVGVPPGRYRIFPI